MKVRLANENELSRINEIRKQLFDLHASEQPEVFKPGYSKELQDYIYDIWNDPEKEIIVAELQGTICGFAVLHHINSPENPYMWDRDFLNVDEFGVDEVFRRKGVGTAMIGFIREFAAKKGYHRIELYVWNFNKKAMGLYEATGFSSIRHHMEMVV